MRKFWYFSQGECYFDCVFVISFKNSFKIDSKYFPRLSAAVCEAHKTGLKDRHPSTLFLCTLHYSSTHYSTMDFSWPSFHLFQIFCDSLDMLLQSISFLKILGPILEPLTNKKCQRFVLFCHWNCCLDASLE